MNLVQTKTFIYILDRIYSNTNQKFSQEKVAFKSTDSLITAEFLNKGDISKEDSRYLNSRIDSKFKFASDPFLNSEQANKLVADPAKLFEEIQTLAAESLNIEFKNSQIAKQLRFSLKNSSVFEFYIFPEDAEFTPVGFISPEEN